MAKLLGQLSALVLLLTGLFIDQLEGALLEMVQALDPILPWGVLDFGFIFLLLFKVFLWLRAGRHVLLGWVSPDR